MAKEKEKEITLIDAFKDFKEEKSIDRPVMLGVLKDVFLTQLAKTYGSADNFDVIINVDKGDCEIYQNFEVVEEVSWSLWDQKTVRRKESRSIPKSSSPVFSLKSPLGSPVSSS